MEDYNLKNKKNFIVVGIVIFLILIVLIFVMTRTKHGKVYLKDDNGSSFLPYINIDTEEINEINDKLKTDYDLITSYNNESYMKYDYNTNNDNMSVLVEEVIKENDDEFKETNFLTYNIDLTSKRVLTFSELLDLYGLQYETVKEKIESELKTQYDLEVKEGYFPGEDCGFKCYLSMRNYTSIDENLKIYENNGKVYGYLNIQQGTMYYSVDDYPKMNLVYQLK